MTSCTDCCWKLSDPTAAFCYCPCSHRLRSLISQARCISSLAKPDACLVVVGLVGSGNHCEAREGGAILKNLKTSCFLQLFKCILGGTCLFYDWTPRPLCDFPDMVTCQYAVICLCFLSNSIDVSNFPLLMIVCHLLFSGHQWALQILIIFYLIFSRGCWCWQAAPLQQMAP